MILDTIEDTIFFTIIHFSPEFYMVTCSHDARRNRCIQRNLFSVSPKLKMFGWGISQAQGRKSRMGDPVKAGGSQAEFIIGAVIIDPLIVIYLRTGLETSSNHKQDK